jgi:penicillin-insensitive murein endopeptidase
MKRQSLFLIMNVLLLALSGCGPSFTVLDQAGQVKTTTPMPEHPQILEEDGYQVVRGALHLQDVDVHFNEATKMFELKGQLKLTDAYNQAATSIDMILSGAVDSQGFAALRPTQKMETLPPGIKLAAKATCLGKKGDCSSSFIDIYLAQGDLIYHQQIEARQDKPVIEKPRSETPNPEIPKAESPKAEKPIKPAPVKPDSSHADDDEQENDEADEQGGRYVGNTAKDIEDLFEIKPKPDNKVETPVKEEKPKVTKVSQAIDTVNKGHLENAASALDYQTSHAPVGYFIMRPQRKTHFGTNELIYMLSLMGQYTKQEVPNYVLPIGDLAKEDGGTVGQHKSHQTGLDVDVGYYFENKNLQKAFASAVVIDKPHTDWMVDKQWGLYKKVVKTQLVDRIFIHKTLKKALCQLAIKNKEIEKSDTKGETYEVLRRLIADVDHNTHFHLRLKCSKAQIRCRPLPEPAQGTGCF